MTLPQRIADKIDVADCWYWTAYVRADGYGACGYEGSKRYAHRVVYELLVGPIPEGLQLDHLCRVRHCVNPDHLEPVTPAENARRGAAGARMAVKTHCPQGHPYDEDNTYVCPNGKRNCRTCRRESYALYAKRKKVNQMTTTRQGWKIVRKDGLTSYGFYWPMPVAQAGQPPVEVTTPGPHTVSGNPCPSKLGDGVCLARTAGGASSGGIALAEAVGLLITYRDEDVLGGDENKTRVSRCTVTGVFDPVALIRAGLAPDLQGANLQGANLWDANLQGADLRDANLWDANLPGADLRYANLWGANLRGANLRGANLWDANLQGADLRDANLRYANLRGANLRGANLWDANLRDANLRDANLWDANLRDADLRYVNQIGVLR